MNDSILSFEKSFRKNSHLALISVALFLVIPRGACSVGVGIEHRNNPKKRRRCFSTVGQAEGPSDKSEVTVGTLIFSVIISTRALTSNPSKRGPEKTEWDLND